MQISGCISSEVEAAFLAHRLDATRRRGVVQHLAECRACYARVVPAQRARSQRRRRAILSGVVVAAMLLIVAVGSQRPDEAVRHFLNRRRAAAMLLTAVEQNAHRIPEPRLSQPLPYRALAPVRGPGTWTLPSEAGMIFRIASRDPSPDNVHAAGVLALLSGKWNAAVALLEKAAGSGPNAIARIRSSARADILSDLAAAYYERARDGGDASDLTLAFTASARAIELDTTLAAPRCVYALVLESLQLRDEAAEAWQAYLARDATSAWASEARERLRRLAAKPADLTKAILAAATENDERALRNAVSAAPREARSLVEEELLGRWGKAVLRHDSEDASATFAQARRIARALAAEGLDRTPLHSVERIERAVGADITHLAEAHVAYRDARAKMDEKRDAVARDAMTAVARRLTDVRAPLASRAAIYAATMRHYHGANDEARAEIRDVLEQLRGREHEYPLATGQGYWSLASIDLGQRLPHAALQSALRARPLLASARETSNITGIETVLADLHRHLGNDAVAWTHRLRAFRTANNATYIRRQLLLAETTRAATKAGHFALARVLARRIARNAALEDDNVFAARALLAEAEIVRAMPEGNREEAMRLLDRAWIVLHSRPVNGSTSRFVADIATGRAELLIADDPAAAARLLEEAKARLVALDHRSRFSRLQLLLGRAREQLGDRAGAEREYLEGLGGLDVERASVPFDQQRSLLTDTARPLYESAVRVLLARGAHEEALAAARRVRGVPADARMPYDGTLIEYFMLPNELVTWTTSRGIVTSTRTTISADRLSSLIDRHIGALRDAGRTSSVSTSGTELFNLLIPAAVRSLPPDSRIVIAPDGVVHRVPFATLFDAQARQFLIERFIVSISVGRGAQDRRDPYRSVLVAEASNASGDLPPLDHVATEAESVARSFARHATLRDGDATGDRFLAEAGEYEVVHFAGHAVANEREPAFGALRLARSDKRQNGSLYAYEIESRRFPRTRLVVLSACDTAGGHLSGSGALSFARAFSAAGVPRVIGSLWPVEDQATARIFSDFYDALKSGASAPEALCDAQRRAIATSPSGGPMVWAAFQIYSDSD